jgi:hypothetical protein
MIDPIGPDPSDPTMPRRHVGEIVLDRPISMAHYAEEPAAPTGRISPAVKEEPAQTALAHGRQQQRPSGFQRAISVAKTVLPLVGKMLPLLEGNVVATASNLLAPHPHAIDLKPLEEAITQLQADQRALTFHTSEHKRALRRLEDEIAALREAVQKNAADRAELAEQVAKLAKRTSSFMRFVTVLLVLSIILTAGLVIQTAHIIRF